MVDADSDDCRRVARRPDADGRAGVAGDWWVGGNEQIIATLDGSMFHLRFWESSHRGGLHVYEVPKGEWEVVSQLGAIGEGVGG